jgi:hypothetical protein
MERIMNKLIQLIELRKIQEASIHLSKIISTLSRRDALFFGALLEQLSGNKKSAENKYIELLT